MRRTSPGSLRPRRSAGGPTASLRSRVMHAAISTYPASLRRPVEPGTTVLLVHEFSDHLPLYTWGEVARVVVRALSLGYGLGATIHADALEEVLEELGSPEVGLTDDELSRLGVVLVLRAFRDRATGIVYRRVAAAHYVRPVVRDAAGHVQRLGPAVLATWDPATDAFEDFAWGIVPELAERTGRRAGDFELERDARADYLSGLVRAGMTTPNEVRAALDHYRHGSARWAERARGRFAS